MYNQQPYLSLQKKILLCLSTRRLILSLFALRNGFYIHPGGVSGAEVRPHLLPSHHLGQLQPHNDGDQLERGLDLCLGDLRAPFGRLVGVCSRGVRNKVCILYQVIGVQSSLGAIGFAGEVYSNLRFIFSCAPAWDDEEFASYAWFLLSYGFFAPLGIILVSSAITLFKMKQVCAFSHICWESLWSVQWPCHCRNTSSHSHTEMTPRKGGGTIPLLS